MLACSWAQRRIDSLTVLNIRCGSDIKDSLEEAGFAGEFLEWGDPVCRGPVPAGLPEDAFRKVRAQYISQWNILSEEDALKRLDSEAAALSDLDRYESILLWFEHDLYDQSVLIDLLYRLSEQPALLKKLRLMSIDHFDGEERFRGFGQLSPDQLAELHGKDIPVTAEMVRLAETAWNAFRQPDPTDLAALAKQTNPALPFLSGALMRHLREFPSTRNGLGLTEELMLQAAADGARTGIAVFQTMYTETEPLPYLGDVMFFRDMEHLIDVSKPALTTALDWRDAFRITDFGRAVLSGEEDWIRTNGINEWRGGVHLLGKGPVWRWSEEEQKPVLA